MYDTTYLAPGHTLLNGSVFNGEYELVLYVQNRDGQRQVRGGLSDSSDIVRGPLSVSSGHVQIIDTVLQLPGSISSTATELQLKTVVTVLEQHNSTFYGDYDLMYAFTDYPFVTVFLPTDDAFSRADIDNLTSYELGIVLENHACEALIWSGDMQSNTEVRSVVFGTLSLTTIGNSTYVNGVPITMTDVVANNGVIHVIDGLLVPNGTAVGTTTNAIPPPTAAATLASSGIGSSGSTTSSNTKQSTSSNTGQTTSSSTRPTASSNTMTLASNKSHAGAIAGGVVGGVVGIVLVVALLWFCRRKQRRRNDSKTKNTPEMARSATKKSYHKPELHGTEAVGPTTPYNKAELPVVPTKEPLAAAELVRSSNLSSLGASRTDLLEGSREAVLANDQDQARQIQDTAPQSPAEVAAVASPVKEQVSPVSPDPEIQQREAARMSFQRRMLELENAKRAAEMEHEHRMKLAQIEHERKLADLEASAVDELRN